VKGKMVAQENHYFELADCQVNNYENYDKDKYLHYAIPFVNENSFSKKDDMIYPPSTKLGSTSIFKPRCYNRVSSNIYMITYYQFDELLEIARLHYRRIQQDIYNRPNLFRIFNETRENVNATYLMKIVDIPTYRVAYTALKEMQIKDRIYKSVWKGYSGKSIVSKPMFCTPIWTGRKWRFLMVSEYATGNTLNYHLGFFQRMFKTYNKQEMLDSLHNTVKTLWLLGFSHNDLHDHNIVYDRNTKKSLLIDFESCVQLPDEVVSLFRQEMSKLPPNYETQDIVKLYKNICKKPALSLLCLSEELCCMFTDPEHRNIYNTDDFFMEHINDVI
jgi:serine/threonine protein kinase